MLVSDEFRFHNRVASLAAKLNGLRVMVRVIAAERGDEEKRNRAGKKQRHQFAVATAAQVNLQGQRSATALFDFPATNPNSQERHRRAHDEETRRDKISQDADVWIREMRERIDDEQQQERKEAAERDDKARERQPVSEKKSFACRSWISFCRHGLIVAGEIGRAHV